MEGKKFSFNEVFGLHHEKLENGGWKVVRCKMRTKEEAIRRVFSLFAKAGKSCSTWEDVTSCVRVGKEDIHVNVFSLDGRARMRFLDAVRESLLVIALFELHEEGKALAGVKLLQG